MFDKTYNIDNSTDFPDEIHVHHHRPTTAKQIAQLREIEKEVKDSVLGMVKVENNSLKFNFFVKIHYECFDQYELVAKYELNGQERTVNHVFENSWKKPEDAVRELFKKMSEDIVQFCLVENSKQFLETITKAFPQNKL